MDLLLIEDHADTASTFATLLRKRGYHVDVARNCAEAVQLFRHNHFDAVLCDIGLPDGDGHALVEELLKIRPVKAVALTALGMRADMERSRAAGFVAHLTKPIDMDAICKVLDDVAGGAYEFPLFDEGDFDFGGVGM